MKQSGYYLRSNGCGVRSVRVKARNKEKKFRSGKAFTKKGAFHLCPDRNAVERIRESSKQMRRKVHESVWRDDSMDPFVDVEHKNHIKVDLTPTPVDEQHIQTTQPRLLCKQAGACYINNFTFHTVQGLRTYSYYPWKC